MLDRSAVVAVLLLATAAWLLAGRSAGAQDASPADKPVGSVTAKLMRYCQLVVQRYDANGDGYLDAQEWSAMSGQPATADLDGDGRLTVEEFARYAASYGSGRRIRLSTGAGSGGDPRTAGNELAADTAQTEDGSTKDGPTDPRRDLRYFAPLNSGTPGWFIERDLDGDGQLTLSEFSPRLRTTEVAEFKRYDLNGDGVLTAAELARAVSKSAATTPTGVPANPPPAAP